MEMFEEAVRDLEHVYQQDKTRENKRLLESAKVRHFYVFSHKYLIDNSTKIDGNLIFIKARVIFQ